MADHCPKARKVQLINRQERVRGQDEVIGLFLPVKLEGQGHGLAAQGLPEVAIRTAVRPALQ